MEETTKDLILNAKNMIATLVDVVENKDIIIKKQEKQLETYHSMIKSGGWFNMNEVAKILNYKNIGRNKMYFILKSAGILNDRNNPYQHHVNADRFCIKTTTKNGILFKVTLTSVKGIEYIKKTLDGIGYECNNK